MPSIRRKNPIVNKRRVDDEGEEDEGPDALLQDDDSLSDGSISDDDLVDGSERSRMDSASPELRRVETNGNSVPIPGDGEAKAARTQDVKAQPPVVNGNNDTDLMMNGLKISEKDDHVEEANYDDMPANGNAPMPVQSPAVVGSTAQMDQAQEPPIDRRRREHDEYKKKRDADPAFVPNRGAFFMHDHRHAGPAANGFRPFGRGRGRGRGGIGGPFAPMHHVPQTEPTDSLWTHDMHETVLESDNRAPRQPPSLQGSYTSSVPQAPRGPPVNRSLSSTKVLGNVQVRVLLPNMKEPIKFPPTAVKQYTRLPDHRPPLRRDKPVRISLPDNPPRYIFPAQDRSFIFIPRAMRPNQQGFGGRSSRGRSGMGSIGGYSRRTSVFGGSMYGGTSYSPSVAMSRRSSLAFEIPRDNIISPTGSTMSRPPMPMDNGRPVVRLPPSMQPSQSAQEPTNGDQNAAPTESTSIGDIPQPQTYPLPQKPTFRENRTTTIPMHQPKPQKSVSVADIESPATLSFNLPQQHQQPFHQQVPSQMSGNGYGHDAHLAPHSRNTSYPPASTGTPLSHIPERAIHAQPFQPNPYQQNFYPQQYPMMPTQQQGYYYSQQYGQGMNGQTPAFYPGQQQQAGYAQQPPQQDPAQQNIPQNLVAQEANGMVYYYDAAQVPAVASHPAYQQLQPYPVQQFGGVVGMGGMMTPSPDGFYVPQQPPNGVVYYPQQ